MLMGDPELGDNRGIEPTQLDADRLDTAQLQPHLFKMEEMSRHQSQRQGPMEIADNDRSAALAPALSQVGNQTERLNELLQAHRSCLGDMKLRSRRFNDSHKALHQTDESLVTQGERYTYQYTHGAHTMYRRTTDRDQLLRDRQRQRGHSVQVGKVRRYMRHRIQQTAQQVDATRGNPAIDARNLTAPLHPPLILTVEGRSAPRPPAKQRNVRNSPSSGNYPHALSWISDRGADN